MGFLDSLGDWATKNQAGLNALGNIASPLISGAGAYMQYKAMQENNALAEQAFNYNKALQDRAVAKENMAQDALTNGFNLAYGNNNKKKNLTDYYGMSNMQG